MDVNTIVTEQDAENSAAFYHTNMPIFEKEFKNLSKKSKDRVMLAILKHPLQDDNEVLTFHDKETHLLQLGVALTNAKLMMFSYAAETVQNKQTTNENNETKENN